MPDYAIGDLQGCFEPFQRLLEHIKFDEQVDRLWLVGDLVNRGPQSLEVLRFLKGLKIPPRISLGNHDLYLLTQLFSHRPGAEPDDSLAAILTAPDRLELAEWLRKQKFLHHDSSLNVVMTHAGIPPMWNLQTAIAYAQELEVILSSAESLNYLAEIYGNQPTCWSEKLRGYTRLRLITNYFTRMRFCDAKGCLLLDYKGPIAAAPSYYLPWYQVPARETIDVDIIFGHWSALEGKTTTKGLYALDTGCVWGGPLTALRLQDRQYFSVTGL